MSKGKAFLVVGHEDWGKSTALKALTGGRRYRTWKIESIVFFIRRMSNDGYPEDFLEVVKNFDPKDTPHLIAALCPTFNKKKALPVLRSILDTLKRRYNLFFFVLRHKGQNPEETIPNDEIDKLKPYGIVRVFKPEGAKPQVIAKTFQTFIKKLPSDMKHTLKIGSLRHYWPLALEPSLKQSSQA
jgi:hypothetical protein